MNLAIYLNINFGMTVAMVMLLSFLLPNKKIEHSIKTMFIILIVLTLIDGNLYALERYMSTLKTASFWHVLVSYICYVDKISILYILLLIFVRDQVSDKVRKIMALPMIIGSLLEGTIFFSPIVYYYDRFNGFHTGPLYMWPNYVAILYLVLLLILGKRGLDKNKTEIITLATMCIFIFATIVYEAIYIDKIYLREITLALSIVSYYMYFTSQIHLDELEKKEEERIKAEENVLKGVLRKTIFVLSSTVDAKDKYTNGHSARVASYAAEIAKRVGKTSHEITDIYYAGLLHDIGKIGVPEDIINKPSHLTDEEYEKIKLHSLDGYNILKQIDEIPALSSAARSHHERFDGKGYPDHLKGEEIPEIARIIAVADAYDAMTSNRSYREYLPQKTARAEIEKGIGTQFDPRFAKCMLQMIDSDTYYELRQTD